MKTIDDYVDDIEDVLSQEMECTHSQDWDEFNTYDSAEYSLSARGRLQIWQILYQLKQDTHELVIEIVSKVADERYEREKNKIGGLEL